MGTSFGGEIKQDLQDDAIISSLLNSEGIEPQDEDFNLEIETWFNDQEENIPQSDFDELLESFLNEISTDTTSQTIHVESIGLRCDLDTESLEQSDFNSTDSNLSSDSISTATDFKAEADE